MRPHRVRLTHSLVENYHLNQRMLVHRPEARSKEQIENFHCDGAPSSRDLPALALQHSHRGTDLCHLHLAVSTHSSEAWREGQRQCPASGTLPLRQLCWECLWSSTMSELRALMLGGKEHAGFLDGAHCLPSQASTVLFSETLGSLLVTLLLSGDCRVCGIPEQRDA